VTLRHFLDVDDVSAAELASIVAHARRADPPHVLAGATVGLLFEKPSARTRSSMEVAVVQLGGHPVSMRNEEVGIDTRETAEDLARTMAQFHAAVGARVFSHAALVRMAAASTVPMVNLLSDAAHPCQAIADVLTLDEALGRPNGLHGRTLAYVGDGNNVCASLILAGALTGMAVRVAAPKGYEPDGAVVARAAALGGDVRITNDPADAVSGADAVYTDVWASMGQESEAEERREDFRGFQVDDALFGRAAAHAVFLHCLPAHRGEEVAASVVDGPRSLVWRQVANRLHGQRGLLLWMFSQDEHRR
jgi:ornithine carbamoyltransferase